MSTHIDIQSATAEPVPDEEDIRSWVAAALAIHSDNNPPVTEAELSIRLVDSAEMAELNQNYRNKNGDTNVLSFPADLPPELNLNLLGDIVICAPVVLREAAQQHKTTRAHWAHMTVHGTLHLLGYDHIEDHEANQMEALESAALARLGFACPYHTSPREEHLAT